MCIRDSLESEGGLGNVGMRVGRILHERKATVATGNPITKDDGRQCTSACSLIAAGATDRHIRHLGIHQPHYVANACKPDEKIEETDPETIKSGADYYLEMGAPKELIDAYNITPYNQLSEYYYASMIDPERQDIVRWGFYSTPGPGSKVMTFSNGLGPRNMTTVREYEFAIEAGSRDAVNYLVDYYLCESYGKRRHIDKAIATLRTAFYKNDNDAGYRLVSMIKNGQVEDLSKFDAIGLISKLADRKYPDAMADLALLHYTGDILPKNYLKAVKLAKEAVKQKSSAGYSALCKFYSDPQVMRRDDIETYKWCDLAIATLGSGRDKDYATDRIHALADRMSDRQIDSAMKREEPWKEVKNSED